MIRIGLTGGIGTGKSTVAAILGRLRIPVIDADQITKNLTQKDQPSLRRIQSAFGPNVMTSTGELDRKKLRAMIFTDAQKRKKLEAILHPAVRTEIQKAVEGISAPYCIIVIPLLIEANMFDLVDKIAVVDCSQRQRIERVMKRDRCGERQVLDVIKAQADGETRLAHADFVIANDGSLQDLEKQLLCMKSQWEN